MEDPLTAADRDMEVMVNIAPKWVMREAVPVKEEVVRAEKEWAIEEGWDAGCIMVAEQAGPHNAHSPGPL